MSPPKQADLEKPGGRRLRRVVPTDGRLVIDMGAATGTLHAAGHLAGIRRGQRVCLVDDDISQDTLILGGKGQGKTTSAMNPMLLQAIRQGAGALIFNVKGDYDRTVLAIAVKAGCLKRVRVIGIGELAENVDILAGVTPEMAASYISAVLLLGDRGKDSQIWNTSAANLARAVLGLLWYFPARYSMPSLYRYLFVDGVAAEVDGEIAALEERIAAANAESNDPAVVAATAKDLRTIRGCTQEIKNYNDQTHDIKRGIALQLTQLLSKMVIPEVEDAFFNHLPQYGPDFGLEQAYEDGTIFVINAPLQLYGLAAAAIMALIKLRFYVTMEQRRLSADANQSRRVGLFIDEFHEITTCSQEGLSDHKFLSTSRDTGTFCVFATQSIPSLTAKIGSDMTDAILANLRQRLYFRNEDTKTIEDALKLLGQTEVSRDTTSVSRNKGSTTKGTSTQHSWQPVAHPELFRNLRRGEALFIGSIGGESGRRHRDDDPGVRLMAAIAVDEPIEHDLRVARERAALYAAVDGVIADGLADASVTEVIVDPNGAVWYDRLYGSLERQRGRDLPSRQVTRIITGIAGMLSKSIRDGILEGELLLDGSRIAAWLPPVCPAPSISIRKHRKQGVDGWPALTLEDYELSPLYRRALYMMAEERRNVLIVGSTGSGKSTFAGAFLNAITTLFPTDRIVTIEDTSELYCQAQSWLALHATPTISQRMLLKTAMRARPDRLILGEVRDETAIDMIMGLTTGHAGFSTIHGGSCLHGLTRTLQLTRLNGENTVSPEMISDAIDYVVLMKRDTSGRRAVADLQRVLCWRKNHYHIEPVTEENIDLIAA